MCASHISEILDVFEYEPLVKKQKLLQQAPRKTILFGDAKTGLHPRVVDSFDRLMEHITKVYSGKQVLSVTYNHAKYGELIITDDDSFAFVLDEGTLTVHWRELV